LRCISSDNAAVRKHDTRSRLDPSEAVDPLLSLAIAEAVESPLLEQAERGIAPL
jgi:hypothetical protein